MKIDWLRGLFQRRDDAPPEFPGEALNTTTGEAVRETEARLGAAPLDSVAAATGLALTGSRAAVFVSGQGLAALAGDLEAAVRRRAAFVVHAAFDVASAAGHAPLHAVADTGVFVAVARNAREAVDLTVVARLVAELALVPGIVAVDSPDAAGDVRLPEAGLVERLLGAAGDEIASPTPAQQMLFGDQRRRVPRWFDPGRPVAQSLSSDDDVAVTLAGRDVFFADPLARLVREALDAFAAATGREPSLVSQRPGSSADAIVTMGGAVEAAAGEDGTVVGIGWLRPFPADELRAALGRAGIATVLEAAAGAPLRREVATATGAPRLLSAFYRGPLTADRIRALGANMAGEARDRLWLGVAPPRAEAPGAERFPRQQVLVQRVQREFPELGERLLATEELPDPEIPRRQSGVPSLVRRFAQSRSTYDSVPRFWNELMHPRQAGMAPVPDPYLALGAVPSCTATFHDRSAEREELPRLDPALCTACGRCWTACPDSALAPVALGTGALLDALSDGLAGYPKKLRRAHKQIAGRIDGVLARSESRSVTAEVLREAFGNYLEKAGFDDQERTSFGESFGTLADRVAGLPLAASGAFFHGPHKERKGSGELLLLALNPQACQGCGICAAECPEDALAIVPQTAEGLAARRREWQTWEELPDTPGASIARAAESDDVGPLPALLLSRHCLFSMTGGDGAEPGSGARLAVRLVAAIAEYQMERRLVEHARQLGELAGRLREAVRSAMTEALPIEDLESLDQALEAAPRHGRLGPVVDRLGDLGQRAGLDVAAVRRLARSAREIEELQQDVVRGVEGTGRARFGLVAAGPTLATWLARFPRNPFSVPVVAELDGSAAELALGLAEGLLHQRVAEGRLVRRAGERLDAPPDLALRERSLDALAWPDLTDEERALGSPLLVFVDRPSLAGAGLAGLSRLLTSGRPIKVILLDDRDLAVPEADPVLLALAHRRAFVLATSVAEPRHFYAGVSAALASPDPALIHIHAPSPRRHGFPSDATVERARGAVVCRVQPLVRYDPRQEGVFGTRLDLAGNPSVEETWVAGADGEPLTPAVWAAAEDRFARDDGGGPSVLAGMTEERRQSWATLQELAGIVTPFTERLKTEIETRHRTAHQAEIDRLRRELEARLAAAEADQRAALAVQLRERLLQLAGYRQGAEN